MLVKRAFKFFAEYFVFLVGLLFIFVIGGVYAFLRPEGLIINIIFLVIAAGWILYTMKYFWDIIDKQKKDKNNFVKHTDNSSGRSSEEQQP